MRELFVYYRIDAVDVDTVRSLVQRFQAELTATNPLLRCRLLTRADGEPAALTCMETYAADAALQTDGIDDAWQARIATAAGVLTPLLRSPRHIEVFAVSP